jgi:membrane protein implicated in regulation of membrane protease activity
LTSKRGWESIKPEQRAGLIAAAIVLLLLPFWVPADFLTNMAVSAAVAGGAYWIARAITRRRHEEGGSSD